MNNHTFPQCGYSVGCIITTESASFLLYIRTSSMEMLQWLLSRMCGEDDDIMGSAPTGESSINSSVNEARAMSKSSGSGLMSSTRLVVPLLEAATMDDCERTSVNSCSVVTCDGDEEFTPAALICCSISCSVKHVQVSLLV